MSVKVIISEASGLLQSEFGKLQAPLASYIEKHGDIVSNEEKLWERIFDTRNSKHFGEAYSYETDMDDMVPVGEAGDYPSTGYQEGYQQLIHNMTFKQSFEITMEAIEDGVLTDLKRKADKMTRGYHRSVARLKAQMVGEALKGNTSFTLNGFSFSTKCMDTACVFSTSHAPKVSGSNQANLFSDAFSATALFKAKLKMQSVKDDDGNTLSLHPNIILIPSASPTLVQNVLVAVSSLKVPGSGNNDVNVNYGDWEVLVSDYLNDYITSGTSPWILFDEQYNKEGNGNIFQKRTDLAIRSELAANDNNVWKARARHGVGFVDWRQMLAGGVSSGSSL